MNTNPIVFLPGVFDSGLYFDTELNRLAWPLDAVEIFRGMAMFNGLITLEQERAHVPLYVPEPVNDSDCRETRNTARIPNGRTLSKVSSRLFRTGTSGTFPTTSDNCPRILPSVSMIF